MSLPAQTVVEAFKLGVYGDAPYPSGTAYEVLSAIAKRQAADLPDVFVFRHPSPPSAPVGDPETRKIEAEWERLLDFFRTWFEKPDGEFKAAFQTFTSTDDFDTQVERLLPPRIPIQTSQKDPQFRIEGIERLVGRDVTRARTRERTMRRMPTKPSQKTGRRSVVERGMSGNDPKRSLSGPS
ncbi:hypothetical protein [Nisaea nitritireducens]|uniref:hypothetical protein n=1 Tax=Nisaea nitritireducens TaxID=568392 RepID=UPI0018663C83|nr:hypothetical protein [Nisaea nitritireducens]